MSTADHRGQTGYEIRVRGRLESRWAAWFDGLTLTAEPDGTTSLRGLPMDQAALHGALQKLCDLGVPLISVTDLDHDPPDTSSTHP